MMGGEECQVPAIFDTCKSRLRYEDDLKKLSFIMFFFFFFWYMKMWSVVHYKKNLLRMDFFSHIICLHIPLSQIFALVIASAKRICFEERT